MMSDIKMILFGGIIFLAQMGTACPNLTGVYVCPQGIEMTVSQSINNAGHTVFTFNNGFVDIIRADGIAYKHSGELENMPSYEQAYLCSGLNLQGTGKGVVVSGKNTGNVKIGDYYYSQSFKLNSSGDLVINSNGRMVLWAGMILPAKEIKKICVRENSSVRRSK